MREVRVVNAIQFVILWNWDLTALLSALQQTQDLWSQGWMRKLHARVLALTIYESLIKLKDFFDKDWSRTWSLRRALRELQVDQLCGSEFDHHHARLTALFQKHESLLEGIRKNAIGHRDQDVNQQIQWVKNANIDEIEQLGWELVKWTTDVLSSLTNVLQLIKRNRASNHPE
jgi:hypothetical protein